jgi:hypothetical protein
VTNQAAETPKSNRSSDERELDRRECRIIMQRGEKHLSATPERFDKNCRKRKQ